MGNALPNRKHSSKSESPNSSTSNTSSFAILDASESRRKWYRYEQGRRFHNFESEEVKYCLPNDLTEQDRLQLQHYFMRFAWKGNYSSPVREKLNQCPPSAENIFRVLDAGCGPGTWILEMASDYPNAEFYGVDISVIFPTEIYPKNVEFRQMNVLHGLPWPDEHFDFVHQRFMMLSYTVEQWKYVINELLRVTKKGGWIELCETSSDLGPEETNSKKIGDAMHQLSKAHGINTHILPELPEMLNVDNQIEKVFVERIDIPVGPWGGRVGELSGDNMGQIFEVAKIPISKYWEITHEEYDQICAAAVAEFNVTKIFMSTGRIYGRKKSE